MAPIPGIPGGNGHSAGGSVKRSLAMAFPGYYAAIAKAFGLDAATQPLVGWVLNPRVKGRSAQRAAWVKDPPYRSA